MPAELKLTKANSITFKLRVNPGEANSTTYELTMPILSGDEGVRPAVNFKRMIDTVFTGMNATTAAQQERICRRVLRDNALQAFVAGCDNAQQQHFQRLKDAAAATAEAAGGDAAAQQAARDNVAQPALELVDIVFAIQAVVTYMCPYKALPRVKRWMRRRCRKGADMPIRAFYNHFSRINDEELPNMPPNFTEDQSLTSDEVVDILLYAIPNSWKKEMDKQGYDPDKLSQTQLLAVLEQMESAETYDKNSEKVQKNSSNKKSKKSHQKDGKAKKDSKDGKYFCMYHKQNTTHATEDCKVLKALAGKKQTKDEGKSKNKTWTRKGDDKKKEQQKELKAFIAESVKEEIHSMKASSSSSVKKRKVIDDDSEGELNLAEFNYEDFEKLDLEDDVST